MAASVVRTFALSLLLAVLLSPTPAAAQVVQVKTVPVAAGDQGLFLPSQTLGMGNVSLAVDDSLADPWSNPGKGVFVREPAFLGSPTLYTISGSGGNGRTFPVAAFLRSGAWFGGFALALQQIDNTGRDEQVFFRAWPGQAPRLSDASNRNLYAQAFVGSRLGDGPWSLGLALAGASLDAMDGVDLLYANATAIRQNGTAGDVRLGLYRQGERDDLGIVLVHNRVSMTHDVTYLDALWDPWGGNTLPRWRVDKNEDKTRTWGTQVTWNRSLTAPGWSVGTLLTVNRMSHPKIPNYEIQNIPRDPGTTWAYEMGMGLSRSRGPTTFGLDVIVQPIWSETWQEAELELKTPDGRTFRPGDRTIENDFFFTNVVLRTGISHDTGPSTTVQAGLELRSYDYTLDQRNLVESSFRSQDESWMEWSPTVGATFRLDDVELRYAGRLTTGTGQPGIAPTAESRAAADALALGGFILAPQGPLTLQDATVMTHQISVRIPIR